MKADRLISLLLLLQSRRQCTARALAQTLEVSERVTAYWPFDILEQNEDDALVRVTFPNWELAVFSAVAWSDASAIESPANLRDAVVERARRLLERYALR